METTIELILAVSVVISSVYAVLISNEAIGRKLGGLYKEEKNHSAKKAQLLVTGIICGGFGIWWAFNPGLLF